MASPDVTGLVTAITPGVARIEAESEGKIGTSTITVHAAAAELVIVSGNGQTGTEGTMLPLPLVVRATDSGGTVVAGAIVHWSTTDGSITPAEAPTGVDGTTSAVWTLGTDPLAVPVARAEVVGLPAVAFTATRQPL